MSIIFKHKSIFGHCRHYNTFAQSKYTRLKYLSALVVFFFFLTGVMVAQSPGDSLGQEAAKEKRIREEALNDSIRLQVITDSLIKAETEKTRVADSVDKALQKIKRLQLTATVQTVLKKNAAYNFGGKPEGLTIEIRKAQGDEGLFYFIVGLLLYFALIRLVFYKYLSSLFVLFFRSTLRQQQLREQLLQTPLPGLLLNIFFVINAGMYFAFLAFHYRFSFAQHFWVTAAYCVVFVTVIYLFKFVLLKLAGWIFGIGNVADAYIFIVFMINKMIGIFLLGILILMAFSAPALFPVVLSLSYAVIILLFIYRFIISYKAVRNEIKLNRLHFFLYLCAFEIAPLLLIYKVLLSFLISSH